MSITVIEKWQERTAAEDDQFVLTAVRVYTVRFEDNSYWPEELPIAAVEADGIPLIGEVHPYNEWFFVKSRESKTIGPFDYEVTVKYESLNDPINQAAEIEWTFASSNESIDMDINDSPILNSSEESFDPPITKDFDDLVLRVTRNEESFDPLQARDYKGAVNSDVFFGFAIGTVKCTSYSGRSAEHTAGAYWTVTYEFQIRADGWKRRLLDQGFRTKSLDEEGDWDGEFETCKDTGGNPLSQPTMLDGEGQKLAVAATAVWLEFDIHPQKQFSQLDIVL